MAEKCPNCGTEIPAEDIYCPECGAQLPIRQESIAAEPETTSKVAEPVISVPTTDEVKIADILDEAAAPVEAAGNSEPVSASESEPAAEEAPVLRQKKKKLKWWMVAIPVVLVIAIAVIAFWTPIFVHLAPNLALANAIANTREAVAQRNTGSVFTVLAKGSDETGKNTIDMTMDYSGSMVGDMRIGMIVRSDSKAGQSLTTMGVEVAGQQMNFNLYADADMAAINLDILTGETYLGANYDTFGEDIRNNDFMYELIGEENVQTVEGLLDFLDTVMSASASAPGTEGDGSPATDTSDAYADIITTFLNGQDPVVDTEVLELDDNDRSCYSLTYTISESQLGELMVQLIDVAAEDPAAEQTYISNTTVSAYMLGIEPDWDAYIADLREDALNLQENGTGEVTVVFYLYDDQIAKIGIEYRSEGVDNDGLWTAELILGENAAESDIIFRCKADTEEDASSAEIILATTVEGETTKESLTIHSEGEDGASTAILRYEWNRSSGDLVIRVDAEEAESEPVDLKFVCSLTELENGFTLHITDIADFLNATAGEEEIEEEFTCGLTYTVTTGAEIVTPEYIDIAQITETDILRFFMNLYEEWEL